MKKVFIIIALTLLAWTSVTEAHVVGNATSIRIEVYIIDPTEQPPITRAPIPTPIYIYREGNNLILGECFAGSTIDIIQGEDAVFSATVPSIGIVRLPNDLSGDFELRITSGTSVAKGMFSI